MFGGRIETVSRSRYTHTSQCFPFICTSPLFSAACTVLVTKLSFERLLAFVPNLSPEANTVEEGSRTSPKHGVCLASVSQVLMHSCAGFTINLAKLGQPTREKIRKKCSTSCSCHRRLKDPTSDVCRSRTSHKQSLILVDKLNVEFREGGSASNQTLDKPSRFHRECFINCCTS